MPSLQPDDLHAFPPERRRHRRLPVTLAARVRHADRWHRTEILDVSDGGLLLSPMAALETSADGFIDVEATTIERVRARIVAISETGVHVRIDAPTSSYNVAIRRLFELTRAVSHDEPHRANEPGSR